MNETETLNFGRARMSDYCGSQKIDDEEKLERSEYPEKGKSYADRLIKRRGLC